MQPQKTPQPVPDDPAVGGTRTPSGSTYGDFVPAAVTGSGAQNDPSRGAELERDNEPPRADFSRRPEFAGSTAPQPNAGPQAGLSDSPVEQAGSHPLGAVFGIVIGALLGALIGLAAGPVGSLFGAVMGGVAGLVLSAGLGASRSKRSQR